MSEMRASARIPAAHIMVRKMKPFALLAARPPSLLADSEYEAYLSMGGLEPHELERFQLSEMDAKSLNVEDYRGFICTGSPYSYSYAQEDKPEEHLATESNLDILLKQILEKNLPFLGVCYGMQAIAVALGDELTQETAEQLSIVEITLTEAARQDPVFQMLPDTFHTILGHEDSLARVPDEAVLLAHSAKCPIQAIRYRDNAYGFQFHPEITMETLQYRLDLYAGRYFPIGHDKVIIAQGEGRDMTIAAQLVSSFVEHYREHGNR